MSVPSAERFLVPVDHPNLPCQPAALAERLGVPPAAVARWVGDGLPMLPDGRIDPYAATNWLSWGRLEGCPLLARRWRAWLRWFTTPARPWQVSVRRSQVCFLPIAQSLRWLVPEPPDAPGQRILARCWAEGEEDGAFRRLDLPVSSRPTWTCSDEIALERCAVPCADRAELAALVRELAGTFAYAYRQHLPGDTAGAPRSSGTCLDLALACGMRLTAQGRPWRLISGVVAHRALANPHFWIEAAAVGGVWVPLDPTIPAAARMLGEDWAAAVEPAVGWHDARRIRVAACEGPVGADLGGVAGTCLAGADEALYCTDWAVGECAWSIAAS